MDTELKLPDFIPQSVGRKKYSIVRSKVGFHP